jgi:methylthioribose-1-phosphate isomerase
MTSIEWIAGKVRFVDQSRLPAEEVYVETSDYTVVGEAIRKLQIRGAPAIGVAAAFGVLLAVDDTQIASVQELEARLYSALNYFSQTRPTAINLFTALKRMRKVYEEVSSLGVVAIRFHLLQEARQIQQEDVESCIKIGEYGAQLIQAGSSVLTHCNTGALATAGDGTAQSIITTAAKQNKIMRVFVDETRPLFQGARLTAWELKKQGIEVILITDSTAGFLMQQRQVNAVLVGADRIAANGDVANKIGTYPLAVLAERHMVPFYVAAPTSTIDFGTRIGKEIPIEERSEEEVTHVAGTRIAAEGVRVFAPAFDITPNQLITAIITEAGILRPPYGESIASLKQPQQAIQPMAGAS